MKKLLLSFVLTFFAVFVIGQNVWINELHYDNAGTDAGEFIELVIENPDSYTLSDFAVYLYNGNGGTTYANESVNNFTAGTTVGNFTIYTWYHSGIQNGAPDGLAVFYQGTLIAGQFLSYEGTLTAADGPANGQTSVDIGVSEGSSTNVGESLQLLGGGSSYSDFVWQDPASETPGALNNSQTLGGTPSAAIPVIAPASGDYFGPISVSMTSSTDGASIYYTTNGDDPTDGSTLYSAPFAVSSAITVKAIAYKTGMTESSIATNNYDFPTVTDIANIAALRSQTVGGGEYFRITGEAILTFQQSFRGQKYLQDATAGILIDDLSGKITTTYDLMDGITNILGTLSEYGGMLQFVPGEDPGAATSDGNTITPEVVSFSQLNSNFEDYESELVKVQNVEFADAGATFAVETVYVITDATSSTYNFRTTFYDVDYIGGIIPSGPQDLVILPNSSPTGEFVTSRSVSDINPASGGSSAVKLDITNVNNGNAVYEGQPFSVTVESQDTDGDPATVDTDVDVTITIGTGTGTLAGTGTGTIVSGTSSVTISGITYTPFESGVVLNVSDDQSDLTTGNSNAFDVLEVIIPAVKLDITTINNGQAVYDGQPFSITVQAQDADGDAADVDADVNVTLSIGTGTGTLGGTLTGTIASGTSSVTISGVTYTPFETAVVLNVSDDASNLTAGNSDAFDVLESVYLASPTNLVAEVGPFDDVQLTWDAPVVETSFASRSVNVDLLGYNVYRDDVQINAALVEVTEYNDPNPSIASHDYYVIAVYDAGQSEPSNVVTVIVTDVAELSLNSINIYPNPTEEVFTIEITDDLILDVTIRDISGKEVYHSVLNKTSQISVSDLQKGVYLVQLVDKSSNNMIVKKLIVR